MTRIIHYAISPRIYVILRGGLGNQLHQIAAGAAIGQGSNIKVRIFAHNVDKSVNLERRGYFRSLDLRQTFPDTDLRESSWGENFVIRLIIRTNYRFLKPPLITEENYFTNRKKLRISFLIGWFQSHDFLPKNFSPLHLVPNLAMMTDHINVHIRLTDFKQIDPDPLDSNYYRQALSLLRLTETIPYFNCFSDDISGAKEILDFPINFAFPESLIQLKPDALLGALSNCKVLICSRSSLCWWAAQIVEARGGIVISPWVGTTHKSSWKSVVLEN